jgi:hypothetical protein
MRSGTSSSGGACSRKRDEHPGDLRLLTSRISSTARGSRPTGAACSVTRDVTRLKPLDVISGEGTATVETSRESCSSFSGVSVTTTFPAAVPSIEFDQVVKVIDPSRIQSAVH